MELGLDGSDVCFPESCDSCETTLDELDTDTCGCVLGYTDGTCSIGPSSKVGVGLGTGAIVGTVLGILCFLLLVGILLVYFKKRLRANNEHPQQQSMQMTTTTDRNGRGDTE
ncbi:hypothetical protein Bbelb_358410 [Branchiostoma belcheri]|nr:hypothetical protein Bbelb_358410 [Branchiostoma belcheri]